MPGPGQQAEPADTGADRGFRASMPSPWDAASETRWTEYASQLVIRSETATSIARYGTALPLRYAAEGPPQSATDLAPYADRGLAKEVLRGSTWDAENVALQSAANAIKQGPEVLLATTDATGFARAANFQIYATTGLYESNDAVPIAFGCSYGEHGEEADDAIARLLNTTTKVARSCDCAAPLVSCDLALAEPLIGRLIGDTQPFAAAIGPDWAHGDITSYDSPPVLLGNSPFELFVGGGDHIHTRARAGGHGVELIAMQYRGRPNGLFYALVPGEQRPFFLLRPAPTTTPGIQHQLTVAADLAVRAAALHDVRPLDTLGLERFYASDDDAVVRWLRHATIVQALLTFCLIDRRAQQSS